MTNASDGSEVNLGMYLVTAAICVIGEPTCATRPIYPFSRAHRDFKASGLFRFLAYNNNIWCCDSRDVNVSLIDLVRTN